MLWIHDYHLIPLGELLRQRLDPGARRRIGFFLHIPFPTMTELVKLPWRAELLRALLAYDLIGFQTERDRKNFLACARHLIAAPADRSNVGGSRSTIPISCKHRGHARGGRPRRPVAAQHPRLQVLLGVDRLTTPRGRADARLRDRA
jgi:trehalose 6-phosphate synthase